MGYSYNLLKKQWLVRVPRRSLPVNLLRNERMSRMQNPAHSLHGNTAEFGFGLQTFSAFGSAPGATG